jgi:membrane protein DedA with SNARE-associated domain
MPQYVESIVGSPWVLAVVFAVAGLDAILPFMPSESTVVAVGVVTAGTGRPYLAALIAAAAAGAYTGDRLSYVIGRRSNRALAARLQRGRRSRAVHEWVHHLLHSRGGLVIVFARYLPGGRSTTAFAAGLVGYPLGRFRWYTASGVLIWATQAALLGYSGGAIFESSPLLGLAAAWAFAAALTGVAVAIQRAFGTTRRGTRAPRTPRSPRAPAADDRTVAETESLSRP